MPSPNLTPGNSVKPGSTPDQLPANPLAETPPTANLAPDSAPEEAATANTAWRKTAWALLIVLIIAVASLGYLWWSQHRQLVVANAKLNAGTEFNAQAQSQAASLQESNDRLGKQNADLQNQLNQKTKNNAPVSLTPSPTNPTPTLLTTLVDILNKRNFDGLAPYLADSVTFSVAASENFGAIPKDQVISLIKQNGQQISGNWNFSLPADTLNKYKAGQYGGFLANATYDGQSDGSQFIAAHVNAAGKVDSVFYAGSTSLLVQ